MKPIRFLIRFLFSIVLSIAFISIALWISGNGHLIKAVKSTYLQGKTGPTIADYKKFDNRKVERKVIQQWPLANAYNHYKLSENEESTIESWESVAFLIVQNDSILFEKYWEDYSRESWSNSFSIAKSLTSLAIGAALQEGKIKSVDQKVGDYLEEFKEGEKAEITIKHLLQMTSGIDFGESYKDPFGFMAKTYYGKNLYNLTVKQKVKYPPAEVWKYEGGNTLLLSFILEKATGQTLSEYFSEHFWKPMGAENDALWTYTKKDGKERAFCCFYSNAADFARVGQLMLDSGKWKNTSLISQEYFEESITPVKLKDKVVQHYGYQWWLGKYKNTPYYYARGILGQYIVCIPDWNVVFVRLGHQYVPNNQTPLPQDLLDYLEIVEKIKV